MRKLVILAIAILISCSKDTRVKRYEQIVNDSDNIRFLVYEKGEFQVARNVTEEKELQKLRQILITDIEAEEPSKFFPNKKFELIKDKRIVGYVMVLDKGADNIAVVKIAGQKDFCFRLTYRIGMYPN